jgi:O-succinylbenzoic acid--CoA ligase
MQKILGLAFPVYQSFGMTETCSHIALRALNGPEKSDQYQVLPGVKISQDARGCLEIWGPVVTREPFVTNDIVELIDDEHFIWKGRADNLINSGGIKLSPEEIEVLIQPILENFGLQRPYFVFGIPDEKLGEKACLLYEDGGLEKDLYTPLLNAMKKHLPPFLAPKAIFTIQNFIYTDTGKVRREETLNEFFKKKES